MCSEGGGNAEIEGMMSHEFYLLTLRFYYNALDPNGFLNKMFPSDDQDEVETAEGAMRSAGFSPPAGHHCTKNMTLLK